MQGAHLEVVQWLAGNGGSVTQPANGGDTPLYPSARSDEQRGVDHRHGTAATALAESKRSNVGQNDVEVIVHVDSGADVCVAVHEQNALGLKRAPISAAPRPTPNRAPINTGYRARQYRTVTAQHSHSTAQSQYSHSHSPPEARTDQHGTSEHGSIGQSQHSTVTVQSQSQPPGSAHRSTRNIERRMSHAMKITLCGGTMRERTGTQAMFLVIVRSETSWMPSPCMEPCTSS